jgi:hypothetical protein
VKFAAFGIVLIASSAFAQETVRIKTPRGAELDVTVHASSNEPRPTIVVSPGQSCNSKGPIFETLGRLGQAAGFTVVRFEWAYCLKPEGQQNPSNDLSTEVEDYRAVLKYAETLPSFDAKRLLISGKSLGSLVAYTVFHSEPRAKALALLTPLLSETTDDSGRPLPEPRKIGDESYPGLKLDPRPTYLTMGDHDSLCVLPVLFDYLKDAPDTVRVSIAAGDHGLRLKKADGTPDSVRTQRNIEAMVAGLLNWADLKLNP